MKKTSDEYLRGGGVAIVMIQNSVMENTADTERGRDGHILSECGLILTEGGEARNSVTRGEKESLRR